MSDGTDWHFTVYFSTLISFGIPLLCSFGRYIMHEIGVVNVHHFKQIILNN